MLFRLILFTWTIFAHGFQIQAFSPLPSLQKQSYSVQFTGLPTCSKFSRVSVRLSESSETPISFENAVSAASNICQNLQNGVEVEESIKELLATSNGARGFFVNYLTDPSLTVADAVELPPAVARSLVTSPSEVTTPLMVQNLLMSTATEIHHSRNGNDDLAKGSSLTAQRAQILIEGMQMDSVWELMEEVLIAAQGKAEEDSYWPKFFKNWGYDEEIIKKLEGVVTATLAKRKPVKRMVHRNGVVELILNRPDQLNALNLQAFKILRQEMETALVDSNIQMVLITAAPGRAFCAGGDIKEVLDYNQKDPSNSQELSSRFLLEEYAMDALIHEVAGVKPVVTVADGIVMGGGAGVFMGGSHRIVTENVVFAMPECAIGLCPDVGSTYFLNQIKPAEVGMYCAVTGARLDHADLLYTGLAKDFVPSSKIEDFCERLRTVADPVLALDEILNYFVDLALNASEIFKRRDAIKQCFKDKKTIQEIKDSLMELQQSSSSLPEIDLSDTRQEWAQKIIEKMGRECPVSQLLVFEAMNQSKEFSYEVGKALGQEFVLNSALTQRSDYSEGVECAVGQKRKSQPKWTPGSIDEAKKDAEVMMLLNSIKTKHIADIKELYQNHYHD